MIKTLFRHEGGLALGIEPAWLDLLEAKAGDSFEVRIDGHSLVLTPLNRIKGQEEFRQGLAACSACYKSLLDKLD